MARYIELDALVAEIERRKQTWQHQDQQYVNGGKDVCDYLLGFLDTIEVKEVDLEREISFQWSKFCLNDKDKDSFVKVAKYFFELGMQASNPLTWKDMMLIHKCCKDAMNCNLYAWETAEGQQKIYEDVLKRFKAQKGEEV